MPKIANNDRSLRDLVSELLADAGYTFHTNIDDDPSTLDDDEPRGYWFAWAAPDGRLRGRRYAAEPGSRRARCAAALVCKRAGANGGRRPLIGASTQDHRATDEQAAAPGSTASHLACCCAGRACPGRRALSRSLPEGLLADASSVQATLAVAQEGQRGTAPLRRWPYPLGREPGAAAPGSRPPQACTSALLKCAEVTSTPAGGCSPERVRACHCRCGELGRHAPVRRRWARQPPTPATTPTKRRSSPTGPGTTPAWVQELPGYADVATMMTNSAACSVPMEMLKVR